MRSPWGAWLQLAQRWPSTANPSSTPSRRRIAQTSKQSGHTFAREKGRNPRLSMSGREMVQPGAPTLDNMIVKFTARTPSPRLGWRGRRWRRGR